MNEHIAKLTDYLDEVKKKITDQEYKNLIETVGKLKIEEEKKEYYLFKYVKLGVKQTRDDYDGDDDIPALFNNISHTYKKKKVYIKLALSSSNRERTVEEVINHINTYNSHQYDMYIRNEEDKDFDTLIIENYKTEQTYGCDLKGRENVIFLMRKIIPISIEKIYKNN